jgi:hypothetical protein
MICVVTRICLSTSQIYGTERILRDHNAYLGENHAVVQTIFAHVTHPCSPCEATVDLKERQCHTNSPMANFLFKFSCQTFAGEMGHMVKTAWSV